MSNRIYVALFIMILLHLGATSVLLSQEKKHTTDSQTAIVDLIRQGEWRSVIERSREVAKKDPNNASMVYIADLIAGVLGDHTQASLTKYDFPFSDVQAMKSLRSWASRLLEDHPINVNFLILNGMLHSPKGDGNTVQFIKYFEKARAIDSKNNFVLEALGSAYGAQGKYRLATQTLEKAIEIKPTSGAYTNLGVALLKQGKVAAAEKNLKKAVEADPLDAAAWFNLGSYYAERNRVSEAKPALAKAVKLNPKNLEARWNLGGIYFNSGQRSKAIEQLREMVRIAPSSTMGRRAKQMLTQFGG